MINPSFDKLQNIDDDNDSFLMITINSNTVLRDIHTIHKRSNNDSDLYSVPFGENKIKYIIDSNFEYPLLTECELCYNNNNYNYMEFKYKHFVSALYIDYCKFRFSIDKTDYYYIRNTLTNMFAKYIKQKNIPFQMCTIFKQPSHEIIKNGIYQIINDINICEINKYMVYCMSPKYINNVKLHINDSISQIKTNNKGILLFHAIMSSSKFSLHYGILYNLLEIIYEYLTEKYIILDTKKLLNMLFINNTNKYDLCII